MPGYADNAIMLGLVRSVELCKVDVLVSQRGHFFCDHMSVLDKIQPFEDIVVADCRFILV